MDGLLVIDKPAGITSHDVVDRVRSILGTRRVGHTGTLDPFATGVMVVLVGRATRLAQFVDKDEKEYEATIRFGFQTDTGDATGSPKSQVQNPKSMSREKMIEVLPRFLGEIAQMPPMFSAKKINGKKLYESARKGLEIARKPVEVTIKELELIDHQPQDEDAFRIRVVCSAGTYIRTLAEDIGNAAGVGAHLTELRRTRSGRFDLSQAITLSHLAEPGDRQKLMLPMQRAVEHLPIFVLSADRIAKTLNGLSTRILEGEFAEAEAIRMSSRDEKLVAIGVFDRSENSIRPILVLV